MMSTAHSSTADALLASDTLPLSFAQFAIDRAQPVVKSLIQDAQARLEAIADTANSPSFASTFLALEDATTQLERAMTLLHHLESVSTSAAIREVMEQVQPMVTAFYSGIAHHEGVWRALKTVAASIDPSQLDAEQARLMEKTMTYFRRHGADLAPELKEELSRIDVELGLATTRFAQNVVDATQAFELYFEDEAPLQGLPRSALDAAAADARARGKSGYRLSLQAPSYIAVMTYLDDAQIRETIWRAYNTRATQAGHDNRPLIREILKLRRRKAQILGFRDFADYALEDRMAKAGDRAHDFVHGLRARYSAAFEREAQELIEFREQALASAAGQSSPSAESETHSVAQASAPIEPWSVGYWAEKLRMARYDLDEEQLRPWFAVPRVMEGMFAVASRLFGIRVEPCEGLETWAPGVSTYRVTDENERHLGVFYADLFPRDNKRAGAWMHGLIHDPHAAGTTARSGTTPDAEHWRAHGHVGLIAANFTPPADGAPALLTHDEVTTTFHEFGHLLHHMLTRVRTRSLAGTNVAWDYVELPSQIMENWCWERGALDLFARHVEDGSPLPPELLERMLAARNFRAASATMRQLGFADLDLRLHREFDPDGEVDLLAFAQQALAPYSVTPLPQDYAMICGFSHLFSSPSGYAAGYYGYQWAEVLDASAFESFAREGVLSPSVGKRFRDAILATGDSAEPEELFRRFAGHDPEQDALLRRSGLLSAA